VPQLGGFVGNYCPAKIHPVQHTFTPPSKNIVFNKNLTNNDGLLANHIARSENTDYPEALKYINEFVDKTYLQLNKGEKVNLDEVGSLFFDIERNLQFEPSTTNYLLDSFGLAQFQSSAIKRDNIGKRIEKEFKDRDAIPQENKKINIKRYVALAITLPLVFGLVWVPLKTDFLKNLNYSSLNPFSSNKNSVNKTAPFAVNAPLNKDTVNYTTVKQTPKNVVPITATLVETSVESAKADSTKVEINEVNKLDLNFHLVTGCFQIEENALQFVKLLQEQNIDASIIGQNKKGLYVVSCGNYATRKEANSQLEELRKVKQDAWLYKD
jgi:cell division septation protein DedD